MKKKSKIMLSLAGLILLIGSLFFLRNQKERDLHDSLLSRDGETQTEDKPDIEGPRNLISAIGSDQISIEYVYGNEMIAIECIDSEWSVNDGQYVDLDNAKLSAIARDLLNLRSMETVSESVSNPGQWGITEESDKINIIIEGTKTTILIGSLNPSQTGYYIQLEDGDELFLISRSYEDSIRISASDLREKRLPAIDVSRLSEIEIRNERTVNIIPFERTDMFTADIFHFMISHPYNRNLPVSNDVLSDLLDNMPLPLSIVDFVDKGNPEDYGISGSGRGFRLADDAGRKLELLLGSEAEKDTVYGKLANRDQIFTLRKEDIAIMDMEAFDFIDKFPHLIAIDHISEVSVKADGNIITGIINRESGEETYFIDGNETEERAFKSFYQNILYLLMEGEAEQPVDTSSALMTISYRSIDGSQKTELNFYPYDKNFYAVTRNDEDPLFTIGIYQLEEMLKKIKMP